MVIGSIFVYYFIDRELRVEIIFRKERTVESGGIDFEKSGYRHLCTLVLVHKLIHFLVPLAGKT